MSLRAILAAFLIAAAIAFPGLGAHPSLASHSGAGGNLGLIHAGVLTVGSDTTYPPMESKNPQSQQYVGADVDLANALAHAMGLKGAQIVSFPFKSIIPGLQRRNYDVIMSSMNDTPDRRKQISFVDYMRLRAAEAIIVSKGSSIHAASYKGLCGHSVSVENGTAELDDLNTANKSCKSPINIKGYDADTDAFQAFAAGHTDAYTTDLPVALYYLKARHGSIRFAGKAFGSGAYYGIGLSKKNKALHAALVAALKKIQKNGQYLRILHKYGLGSTALH